LLVPSRRYGLVPTRANAQPAFGAYILGPDGVRHATGLFVVTLADDRIRAMTRFETSEFAWFGLPLSLPEQ
jgi:RNA polymerase sigma-70 factor (ECF subfamily)